MYENISTVVKRTSTTDVQEFLALGWTLLFVGQYKDEDVSDIVFALGWRASNGSPEFPKKKNPKLGNIL